MRSSRQFTFAPQHVHDIEASCFWWSQHGRVDQRCPEAKLFTKSRAVVLSSMCKNFPVKHFQVGRHTILGSTIDDSIGEAFDKTA